MGCALDSDGNACEAKIVLCVHDDHTVIIAWDEGGGNSMKTAEEISKILEIMYELPNNYFFNQLQVGMSVMARYKNGADHQAIITSINTEQETVRLAWKDGNNYDIVKFANEIVYVLEG